MDKNSILKQVQEIEYEALKVFSDFCEENNIKYFMRGGSVLGAVKYGGYIPWDDDLDIAVPRDDYEKLITISEGKILGGKFIINSYKNNPELHCYFPRMVLSEEERQKRKLPSNTKLGLHIMDIFPLDGAPRTTLARIIYFGKVYYLRVLASLGTVYEGNMINMHTRKQQLVIDVLRLLRVDRNINQQNIYERLDALYKSNDIKNSVYSGTITASLFTKEIFPSSVWGEGVEINFNELLVRVPSKYDDYLKQLYGKNYLNEEPDKKNRKSHLGY